MKIQITTAAFVLAAVPAFAQSAQPAMTGVSNPEAIAPESYTLDAAMIARPGNMEIQLDLFLDDARPVVLHANLETIYPGRFNMHPDFRNDSPFLARIQGIVHGFLDCRQQRLARIVESQKMPVLREELADRDIPLLRRHRFGGDPPPRFFSFFHSFQDLLWYLRMTGQVLRR